MKKIHGTFDLLNGSENEMPIYLEPEGACFLLPPGKGILVKIYGEKSMEMQHSIEEGKIAISMWLDNNGYEILYEGKDVWDWIIENE